MTVIWRWRTEILNTGIVCLVGRRDSSVLVGRTPRDQFVIFKPLSYCFEETTGFDVKASSLSRPLSCLIK